MKTAEALIKEHGSKMIPLEIACKYAGIETLKTAKERAINFDLPFPAFKVGRRNGNWFVNVERLAEYLDKQDKEYTQKYLYKNS